MSTVAGTFVTGSKARYAPFGTMTTAPATNPSISDRGFTGHRMNNSATNDLGLIYMNARYYLPEIGRFISADSIVPDPQNPQNYNRYSYVLNSPTNYTDPTGRKECANFEGSDCTVTLPHATNQQIALVAAWIFYEDNFVLPFEGEQPITQGFRQGPRGHNGIDFGGEFTVRAPADGTVSRADLSGRSAGAGMWRIQNGATGEIREWSNLCNPTASGCEGPIFSSEASPEPAQLLATGGWVDLKPEWSHVQGTIIEIDHGSNLKTVYYHTEIATASAMTVNVGDELGKTANIGLSTGTHLHYALKWEGGLNNSVYLNPLSPPASIAHLLR